MSTDVLAAVRAVADQAAAEGSQLIALDSVSSALGIHYLHIHDSTRRDGWTLRGCIHPDPCTVWGLVQAWATANLPQRGYAGRTWRVWLDDDGALRFREVQT